MTFDQGAPTPRKRSPSGPVSGELRFSHGGGPPDAAWQIPRWTASRDLLSHLCCDGCALWLRNPWADAPTLQHPPFPQVWCGPLNRTSCMPVAQTDGCIPMHECRHLSPPGCFRIRLRVPPSLSRRNIGACRSAGPRITRLVAQISSADAKARTRPAQPVDLLAKPRATGRCEARVAVLTEQRRRCAHAAPIWQNSGPAVRLGRPCVVGAVQVAPTPRLRPREVPRHLGSEAHGASNSRPSNLKLALVAYW